MREIRDLISAWRRLCRTEQAVLATVVGTSGSTYRKAGARMLINREGWVAGSISGGCLESDLVRTAWERTEHGPDVVTYDAGADDDIVWGFGLGCNGVVQVLLERVTADEGILGYLEVCESSRTRALIATVVSPGPSLGRHVTALDEPSDEFGECIKRTLSRFDRAGSVRLNLGEYEVMFEAIEPARSLVVFGAGHDAIPLVNLAKELGWYVTLVDGRESQATAARFPAADEVIVCAAQDVGSRVSIETGANVVLMTHSYLNDQQILSRIIGSQAAYIGVLGPKVRTERLISELQRDGVHLYGDDPRIHAPIGLDLGAAGPSEIALAILSEILVSANGRSARPLRESSMPLHAPSVGLSAHGTSEIPACEM